MTHGYDLDAASPSAAANQARYASLSETVSALPGAALDVAYGDHPRQRLDVFPAGTGAPVVIFFHGGYWRAGTKDARRFMVPHWRERGVSWVGVNYRLTPDAALSDCVDDARDAVAWLHARAAVYGLDPDGFHVTGNSAGAHLAAMVAAGDTDRPVPLRSLCVVSGLFDLAPLAGTKADDWLRLDARTIADLSPLAHLPPATLPVVASCGGAESEAFKEQTRRYAQACRANGNDVTEADSPGNDHFMVIGDYADPKTDLFRKLHARVAGRSAPRDQM